MEEGEKGGMKKKRKRNREEGEKGGRKKGAK